MSNTKKIDFLMIILIILLVIVLFCYAQLKIFNQKYINFCGYTIFRVITGSMADTIEPQDIVIVKITKDVEPNNIITYESKEDFITHRLIEKNEKQLITKGDANTSEDAPITEDAVIGKVVYIINNVSVWINVFTNPKVIIAIVISTLGIIFILGNKPKSQ